MFRRRWIWWILLFVFVTGWVTLQESILPEIVREKILAAAAECKECRLKLGAVKVSLLPIRITLQDVDFGAGHLDTTYVEVFANQVKLRPHLRKLGSFRNIEVSNGRVVLTEGDANAPPGPGMPKNPEPVFRAAKVSIRDTTFTYIRQRKTKQARLDITDIDADVENLMIPPQPVSAEGSAQGVLEGSGEFVLRVTAAMEDGNPNVGVTLALKRQDLAKVKYFAQDDGIFLKGMLVDGKGEVRVKGRSATGTVEAFYKDLEINVASTESRSGIVALIIETVATIKLAEENMRKAQSQRKRQVKIHQLPGESIVAFILRALKDAALDVSSQ